LYESKPQYPLPWREGIKGRGNKIIKGKFADFQIGIAPGGLIGTTVVFITSPLYVPIRRIFSEDLPPAGQDVC